MKKNNFFPGNITMNLTCRIINVLCAFFCTAILVGCTTHKPYDYTALRNSNPRSIVVIPPQNNSIDVNASYIFLSTISKPLAEKGYYVFPVSVIDSFLKENGLPTPAEMNTVPLDKIRQHIGADAVLYVSIVDWGQKYELLSSKTVVHATLRLVDARTGTQLWDATAQAEQDSNSGNNNGLIGAIVGAIVQQIAGSVSDRTPGLAAAANTIAIDNPSNGLLNGPYVPANAPK